LALLVILIFFVFAYSGLFLASLSKVTGNDTGLVGHPWLFSLLHYHQCFTASNTAHMSWLANLCFCLVLLAMASMLIVDSSRQPSFSYTLFNIRMFCSFFCALSYSWVIMQSCIFKWKGTGCRDSSDLSAMTGGLAFWEVDVK